MSNQPGQAEWLATKAARREEALTKMERDSKRQEALELLPDILNYIASKADAPAVLKAK